MKYPIRVFFMLIIIFVSSKTFAEKNEIVYTHTYQYRNIAGEIRDVSAPYEIDNHLVFTAKPNANFVGIAFDFENFQTIHPFELKKIYDINDKESSKLYFYILELPRNLESISYRMIIDGLWTTDPLNKTQEYDTETGITFSKVKIQTVFEPETEIQNENNVRFVYQGKSGKKIRLAGNFTNWDSWIYELSETSPGFYELSVPLPTGTYYYAYFVGTVQIPDATNPKRAYTEDGRTASVLVIN